MSSDTEKLLSESGFSHVAKVSCVSINHGDFVRKNNNNKVGYSLNKVEDDVLLDVWCKVLDESFSMNKGDIMKIFGPAKSYLFDKNTLHHLYILRDSSQVPVSAALLYLPLDKKSDAGHSLGYYC